MPIRGGVELTVALIATIAALALFVWSATQVDRPRKKPRRR